MHLTIEKLLANLPIFDFYYILTGRIDYVFPFLAYMSKRKKLLAQAEHLAYLFVGFFAEFFLGKIFALIVLVLCWIVAIPSEAFLAKKYPKVATWEWAKNKSYKFIFSVFGWISINVVCYYVVGVFIGILI